MQVHGECVTGLPHSFSKQIFKHGIGLLKLPIYHRMGHVLKRQEMMKKALVEARKSGFIASPIEANVIADLHIAKNMSSNVASV